MRQMIKNGKIDFEELMKSQISELENNFKHDYTYEEVISSDQKLVDEITDSIDAAKIIKEIKLFENNYKQLLTLYSSQNPEYECFRANSVASLYIRRNVLISSFHNFITFYTFNIMNKIYNEAINRDINPEEKTIHQYYLPKMISEMLPDISLFVTNHDGYINNTNPCLFAELIRNDMINLRSTQLYNSEGFDIDINELDELNDRVFNYITLNLIILFIQSYYNIATSFVYLLNSYDASIANEESGICQPHSVLVNQPYDSYINQNLKEYNREPLFRFLKDTNAGPLEYDEESN